jgi:hypothetical protein
VTTTTARHASTRAGTIGQAILLSSSGNSIRVAAATYGENLTIGFSLKIIGTDARRRLLMAEPSDREYKCPMSSFQTWSMAAGD